MEKRNHLKGGKSDLSRADLDQLWEDLRNLHRSIDETTQILRQLTDTELIRRAEEAGAAVQRLEWEMARYRAKQEKDTPGREYVDGLDTECAGRTGIVPGIDG